MIAAARAKRRSDSCSSPAGLEVMDPSARLRQMRDALPCVLQGGAALSEPLLQPSRRQRQSRHRQRGTAVETRRLKGARGTAVASRHACLQQQLRPLAVGLCTWEASAGELLWGMLMPADVCGAAILRRLNYWLFSLHAGGAAFCAQAAAEPASLAAATVPRRMVGRAARGGGWCLNGFHALSRVCLLSNRAQA